MPRFQKLYEKYRDRTDVLLLSLNQDSNPAVAEAFMKEHHLTFPVLPASYDLLDEMQVSGIPDNRIVDAGGIVRLKQIQYNPSRKWEEWMSDLIEQNRPAASLPSPTK